jgi:trimethylamine--corrinoid protein Co-methyltransferase
MSVKSVRVTRPWEPLTKDEIYNVHVASMEILEKVGVMFSDEQALKFFCEGGADIQGEVVKIPEHLVKECVKKAPERVILYGRNPKYNVNLQDNITHFTACSEATYILDMQTDDPRLATKKDLADLSRMVDALEYYSTMLPSVVPQDVTKELWLQHALEAILNNTEKHAFFICPTGADAARDTIRMAAAVAGDEEALRKRPIITGGAFFSSPLRMWAEASRPLIEYAKFKVPINLGDNLMMGATCPITLAGALAQGNAEMLSGVVLAELVNPGTPVLYNSDPFSMDMRTSNISISAPEKGICNAALAQIARYYGFPTVMDGFSPDSKVNDMQAGYEKAVSGLASALSGANLIMGAGLLAYGDYPCFKSFVIDNEILGYIHRVVRGIKVNEETLAVDVIAKVGHKGNFLGQKHTNLHLREEHFIPEITDRYRTEKWKTKGSKSIVERAKEKAIEILKSHYPENLNKDVQKKLKEIIKESERREIQKT